jgi:hypothetical protein
MPEHKPVPFDEALHRMTKANRGREGAWDDSRSRAAEIRA